MNYIVMKKDFIIYSIIRRYCRYQRCNLYKKCGDSYTGCVVGGGSEAPEYVLYCGTCDMYHVSRGGDGLCKKQ